MIVTVTNDHKVSYGRACKELGVSRSSNQYKAKQKDDQQLIGELELLIEKFPAIGFRNATTGSEEKERVASLIL